MEERYYQIGDISLHAVEAGNQDGQVMLFLHGFPEFWYGWHKQLDFFAEKGFRAVAADQRGYNLSSKPENVDDYTIENLTCDIAGLIPQLTTNKVVLVGHDWGGAVAWATAMQHPALISSLVILNMPHPAVMHEHLTKDPEQMLKSSYAAFFQLPILPELLGSVIDFTILKQAMINSSKPGTFTDDMLERYEEAWKQPGALNAMFNWYRAYKYKNFDADHEISSPTLLIWGKQDKFLVPEMALQSIEKCSNGKLVFQSDATHWLHHEKAKQVNDEILQFILAQEPQSPLTIR
ncbi:alpha/beta fold hydrolase [Pontibacter ruber]|uniref:Alpha/beta fold hydrolase n=1 Tax=Pontibacter ruber TaxID=1343895 RepID=A0ABW5D3K0_9BACT|nr:alpha/beta hydrolase [Pontibacter ruber]